MGIPQLLVGCKLIGHMAQVQFFQGAGAADFAEGRTHLAPLRFAGLQLCT